MGLNGSDVGYEGLTFHPLVGSRKTTMHGLIHLQLQRFVESRHGAEVWRELNRRAGLESRVITALQSYPDEDMTRLVTEAVGLTGVPAADLLEAFGQFLAPAYLSVYSSLVKPDWRTLELLENTERTIHRVVRVRQPGATPPVLSVERTSDTEVLVTYGSHRRLCAVARGIIRGVAAHYREQVYINERTCMLRGGDACRISVRLQPARPAT
jgi:predicted hydrocarbon binding protein